MVFETILVVNDEADIRDNLCIYLTDIGYYVITAENGEKALLHFRSAKPSIVFADIRMPRVDGIELLRIIKEESPQTEVIMMAGPEDLDLALKSLKYEAADFVTKPIDNDVLEITLRRARERISMRAKIREQSERLQNLVREKSEKVIKAEKPNAFCHLAGGLSPDFRDILENLSGSIACLDEMPCMACIYDRNEQVIAVNQLCIDLLGNITGRYRSEIYSSVQDQYETRSSVAETFITGKGQRSGRDILRVPDGREAPVVVHPAPIRSSDGIVELVLELAVEIHEINSLKEELRITGQRYHQLFNEAPCYITVLDKSLRITATNRNFENDFGYGLGRYCYEIYKHRDQPCTDCPVLRTIKYGTPQESESVVTSQTGAKYNVLMRTAPIRDISGEISQVLEMSTNITEIRQIQDRLSSVGLLIGSISHSMKGLLTGLDGGIYKIDSGLTMDNYLRVRDGWDGVKLTLGLVKRMILDLLYYAKEKDLNCETMPIANFTRQVAAQFQQKLESRPIRFDLEMADSLQEFCVDPGALTSVLMNILENALDACMHDKVKSHHEVVLSVKENKGEVLFEIRDNGIGMDEATKEKLFTPCFSTKGTRGTGLGLFISKEIVRRHGGSIAAESFPGQGSRFIVRLTEGEKKESADKKSAVPISCREE